MHENDLLAWFAANAHRYAHVGVGIGDDMAGVVIHGHADGSSGVLALLKVDQALDRVHFDLREHTPRQAGVKAVNRCLSDCAAMACRPRAILIAVALPQNASTEMAQELFKGCESAAGVFGCPIVGGDTAVWDQRLAITVAAMGESPVAPVRRHGAAVGDAIILTGRVGGSILGRHLTFTPRIAEAQAIHQVAAIHAMMDLSDGLAQDLPRLLAASGVGAVVEAASIPIHPDAHTLARTDGQTPLTHALVDGEDYELLLTLAPADVSRIQALGMSVKLTVIGTITARRELRLQDEHGASQAWPRGGWEYESAPA
ncbi:MAG: thiamine-monophosphate kinase [Phycisphaerae bacterium]|nr:thiamine-monophosphate kinase [Phycisphaerae bacterium]